MSLFVSTAFPYTIVALLFYLVFVIIQALLVSAFLLVVPIVAERWGKMRGLDRALGQIRVGFIVEVTESVLVVLLASVLLRYYFFQMKVSLIIIFLFY